MAASSDRALPPRRIFLALDPLADQFVELIRVLLARSGPSFQQRGVQALGPALRFVEHRCYHRGIRHHGGPLLSCGWLALPIGGEHA